MSNKSPSGTVVESSSAAGAKSAGAGSAAAAPAAKPVSARWPTPPFAPYPRSAPPPIGTPCTLEMNDGRIIQAKLAYFLPQLGQVQLRLLPDFRGARASFAKVRCLSLIPPVEPIPGTPATDFAPADTLEALGDATRGAAHATPPTMPIPDQPYVLHLSEAAGGARLEGSTVGHVENDAGLYLFPPLDAKGSVGRLFYPRTAYARFESGPKLGEILVAQQSVSPQQVADALHEQEALRGRRLGDVLLARQAVSPNELVEALEQQSKMPSVRLGEALLSLRLITNEELEAALVQQRSDGKLPLGELLIRRGKIQRADLQLAMARKMGYPLVDLSKFPCEIDALRALAHPIAQRLNVLPLMLRSGRLVVAVEDPTRRGALDEVEFATQLKVVPAIAAAGNIAGAIQIAYHRSGIAPDAGLAASVEFDFDEGATKKLMASLEREDHSPHEEEHQIEQSDNSLVRLINQIVIDAHAQGASDVHFECMPGREKIKVRFRKDGVLALHLELPHTYRNALVARIKIMCDLDISERRKPQDGKINFAKFSPAHKLELRVATIPTNNSLEDVVLRLLASAKPIPLAKLGLAPRNQQGLEGVVSRPYGMILCVGPTGSGKTTTLHSLLHHINTPDRKIWTAEDPVEITQMGLRQVQVNPKIDWTFARALRAFLRADPDVIMVGEIRDGEAATMAVEASLTGHLVLSTLHTNSAPETVTRLLDMGLDPFNFADSLLAVLAQRLTRRLCSDCRTARPATDREVAELAADYKHAGAAAVPDGEGALIDGWRRNFGRDGQLVHWHAPGCQSCNGSGLRGRVGLHELMVVTPDLREKIQGGTRSSALQAAALTGGMRTLRQDGLEKVLQGLTTLDEVRATSNG